MAACDALFVAAVDVPGAEEYLDYGNTCGNRVPEKM